MARYLRHLAPMTIAVLLSLPSTAMAGGASCDRKCLIGIADGLLESMVAHDPAKLPLAQDYAATENSVPAALNMMTMWRTATAAKDRYYVVDPKTEQLFLIATIAEGGNDTLLFGRIKIMGQKLSEIELYTNRSRGEGGFQYDGTGPSHLPREWLEKIPAARLPSRAQLLEAGRSIFDTSLSGPPPADACVVMENGKIVAEDPDVLAAISPPDAPKRNVAPDADGKVTIPCGSPPDRPTDIHARTDIIDEEQGVVVSMAVVEGLSAAYLATTPTESAFVPKAMFKSYGDMLQKQVASGLNPSPRLRTMAATGMTTQINRIYDGRIQGLHLLVHLGPAGATNVWTSR